MLGGLCIKEIVPERVQLDVSAENKTLQTLSAKIYFDFIIVQFGINHLLAGTVSVYNIKLKIFTRLILISLIG